MQAPAAARLVKSFSSFRDVKTFIPDILCFGQQGLGSFCFAFQVFESKDLKKRRKEEFTYLLVYLEFSFSFFFCIGRRAWRYGFLPWS